MQDGLHKTIIGVTDWCLDCQGPAAVSICAALGFTALQIGIGCEAAVEQFASSLWQADMRASAEKHGVLLAGIALNALETTGTGASNADPVRRRALQLARQAVRAAEALGATLVYAPAFGKSRIDSEQAIERAAEFLLACCRIAADHGLVIASENTLGPAGNLRLVDAVGHPDFRIMIDTYNPRLWGHDVCDLIFALPERLADHAHVKDGVGEALGSAALGTGEGEVRAALDALSSIGWAGAIFLENDYRGPNRARASDDICFVRECFPRPSVRHLT